MCALACHFYRSNVVQNVYAIETITESNYVSNNETNEINRSGILTDHFNEENNHRLELAQHHRIGNDERISKETSLDDDAFYKNDSEIEFSMPLNTGQSKLIQNFNAVEKCYSVQSVKTILQQVISYFSENPHLIADYLGNDKDDKIYDLIQAIDDIDKMPEDDSVLGLVTEQEDKIGLKKKNPINKPECKSRLLALLGIAHDAYKQLENNAICPPKSVEDQYVLINSSLEKGGGDLMSGNYLDKGYSGFNTDTHHQTSSNQLNKFPMDTSGINTDPQMYQISMNDMSNVAHVPSAIVANNKKWLPYQYTDKRDINKLTNFEKGLLPLPVDNTQDFSQKYSLVKDINNETPKMKYVQENVFPIIPKDMSNKVTSNDGYFQDSNYFVPPQETEEFDKPSVDNLDRDQLPVLSMNEQYSNDGDDYRIKQIISSVLQLKGKKNFNLKIIEILNLLMGIDKYSAPNEKINHILLEFLNSQDNYGNMSTTIDTLLQLLKLNGNHYLPKNIIHQIIQILDVMSEDNSREDSNKIQYELNSLNHNDKGESLTENNGYLLDAIIKENPSLLPKLVTNKSSQKFKQAIENVSSVELIYSIKEPIGWKYQTKHYVKYRIPLSKFIANVKHLLVMNPHLESDPKRLFNYMVKFSTLTDVSSALKKYSAGDISRLIFEEGALVSAHIVGEKDNSLDLDNEMKEVQEMNSNVPPEDILEQTGNALGLDFKGSTQNLGNSFISGVYHTSAQSNSQYGAPFRPNVDLSQMPYGTNKSPMYTYPVKPRYFVPYYGLTFSGRSFPTSAAVNHG